MHWLERGLFRVYLLWLTFSALSLGFVGCHLIFQGKLAGEL